MNLKETINADFMTAYKAREMDKKNFLGLLKGAIQNQEGKLIPSTDENVLKVIKSFEKGLNETLAAKLKLGEDVNQINAELSYLAPYLPQLMSEEEVSAILNEILSRDGISKNQGFLMGIFNKENKGKAFDNKMVNELIKKSLV